MKVRALKSFKGRYGLVRTGQIFNAEPGYAEGLKRNGLIEIVEGEAPGPTDNRAIPQAPVRAGKEVPSETPPLDDTAPQGGSGQALTSASLPAARATAPRTAKKSGRGAPARRPLVKTLPNPPAAS